MTAICESLCCLNAYVLLMSFRVPASVGADDPLIQAALEQINEDTDKADEGDTADEGGDQKTE